MSDQITRHLRQRFETQRILFWHDAAGDYADSAEDLVPEDVVLLRVHGDEFGIKHRLLTDQESKYLVYRSGEIPTGTGDWLLDQELAHGVFVADRTAIIQQELGIENPLLLPVIEAHPKFFAAASRKQALEKLLVDGDDPALLRAKMCQVLLKSPSHRLSDVTREILLEAADGGQAKIDELTAYGLDEFFWTGLRDIYGYQSDAPTVDDFVLWIFARAMDDFSSDTPDAYRNIRNDYRSLIYDVRTREAMKTLATRAAQDLGVASKIENRSLDDLKDQTTFEEIEQKIVADVAAAVAERTMGPRDVAALVRHRRDGLWYEKYESLYTALQSASELLAAIAALPDTIDSVADGLTKYQSKWFRIDQHYRHFIVAGKSAEYQKPLIALKAEIDKQYANRYLYALGSAWQTALDALDEWKTPALSPQRRFYDEHVAPILSGGRSKAVVIISDALRYEIAEELASRIRSEDRYDAELTAVLGSLPSYTQLGMAALLPHSSLEIDSSSMPVYADGRRTDGTANRAKILQAVKGTAIGAQDVINMPIEELRELYKAHQVVYVYHNAIDATGDDGTTEQGVFEAAGKAMNEIIQLLKRWTNANATNILITADHGFLYQDIPLEQSYFLSEKPQGDEVSHSTRRFVLGKKLRPSSSFMTFTAAQAGLAGDLDIQIPKSIHRIPQPGKGTRYVHGGASLQEIVVPVIAVNKKRKSDVRTVAVDLMPETDKITTGQLTVKLVQREAVTDKIQPLRVRLGLYVGDVLISDRPILTFDSTSENQHDRYQNAVLYLTQDADEYNRRAVELRLEEPIPNTTQWRTFSTANYTLRRSFTTDFDF
ncbi:BREX-1 system phosphatase PglZ type A [Actinomyces culturomici]|uniref:BREX-1 system phosphatase PglZ type A n=1 Tax=Actinomyces culturomici TaxID=1926276 RepID=UPI000E207B77|nr:BREX-1 system phosphatase PglZ type A [Actinomyces culturomici]